MSEQQLERSVLEGKERDELHAIADALGLKPGTRTKKADLVDGILRATGVEVGEDPPAKPKRTRKAKAAEPEPDAAAQLPLATAAATEVSDQDGALVAGGGVAQDDRLGAEEPDPPNQAVGSVPTDAEAASPAHEGGSGVGDEATDDAADDLNGDGGDDGTDEGADDDLRGGDSVEGDGGGRVGADHAAAPTVGVSAQRRPAPDARREVRFERDERPAPRVPAPPPPRPSLAPTVAQHVNQNQSQPAGGAGSANLDSAGQPGQAGFDEGGNRRSRRRRNRDRTGLDPAGEPAYAGDPIEVAGLLDLKSEGFGFLRTRGYLGSPDDIYVSTSQVRRFSLRPGDLIVGASRSATTQEKFPALLQIDSISGQTPDEARRRPSFDELTPIFPDAPLSLEVGGDEAANVTGRAIDLVCPIGLGQRALVVGTYKSGKSTILRHIAAAIEHNHPEVVLLVVLIDERPEEITELRRAVAAEVVGSAFDRPAEEHTQVVDLAIEKAKRLVEQGRDVVVLLDGATRLARAHNLTTVATGRSLMGGLDAAAINPTKRVFGAARNTEEAGSLTIIATALTDTGSDLDASILDELRGTATMELRLDRHLAARGVRPAVDVVASSTLGEERLFEPDDLGVVWQVRRSLVDEAGDRSALEVLLDRLRATPDNGSLLAEAAGPPAA